MAAKILADFHHSSLYRSLQLLLDKRLGHELYRPIGMGWYDSGYWKISDPYPNPRDTALQFLDTRGGGYERGKNLNGDHKAIEQGLYEIYDPDHKTTYKAITFERFQKEKFDILLASYIDHIIPYWKLIQVYQPKAKLIHQAGNNWSSQINWSVAKNVMAATAPFTYPSGKNVVFYHEELDPNLFTYEPSYIPKTIMSFVNVLHGGDLKMFEDLEREMPDFNFFSYGAQCRDGSLPVYEHAEKIKQTQFQFHWKAGGDGMGITIHAAFACGKPPIVNMSQYKGQLAYKLMKDGETCIDIGSLTAPDAAKKILRYSDKDVYQKMSRAAKDRFDEIVDYERETEAIKRFLEKLI